MNDPETKPVAPEAEDVQQQCACLQRQITTLLLALIIVSGTLTVFLWRQKAYARRDLEAMQQPAAQIIQDFNQNQATMKGFVDKIAEYGRTHPDFMPILTKYRIPVPTGAPPAAATAPKPAAPAPKK
jgi:hypothetical protein